MRCTKPTHKMPDTIAILGGQDVQNTQTGHLIISLTDKLVSSILVVVLLSSNGQMYTSFEY